MMYNMKNIISHDLYLDLPKCMYSMKNPIEFGMKSEINLNISAQVKKLLQVPNNKMAELGQRQDQLLKKLDILYEKIKAISSICAVNSASINSKNQRQNLIKPPEEIVMNVNPDNLPYYLNIFLKESSSAGNIIWHIHSSVPNNKVTKIKTFVENLKTINNNSKINVRLIFKSVSANPELKLSPLAVPIIGNVNILRFFALAYPNVLAYDNYDYAMDSLLDLCHVLENTVEKNKDAILSKLFSQCKDWIYNNQFSIIDVAAYNVIKQLQSKPKSVPKGWFDKCDKIF